MLRPILAISFILFHASPIQAQVDVADSLINHLDNLPAKSSKEKADLLLQISASFYGHDFQASEEYAINALKVSEELSYQQGVGEAYLAAAKACVYLSKGKEGLEYIGNAQEVFQIAQDTSMLADAIRVEGVIQLNFAEYEASIALFEKSARIARISGDKAEEAFAIMDIGIAYIYLSGREKALEYFLDALPIAEESQDKNAIGNVKNSIGQIYFQQEKYAATKQMMEQALDLALQIDNPILSSDCYYYLSRIALKDERFKDAISLNIESMHIDSLQSNFRGLAHKHILHGDIYMAQNNLEQAKRSFENGRAFTKLIQDKDQTEPLLYIRLGVIERLYGNYNGSIEQLEKAIAITQRGKLLYWEYEANKELAEVYEALGRYEEAYQYHKRYSTIKDSVINTERNEDFNRLQVLYEDAQKKAEIERLSNESIIQKQELALSKVEASQRTQQIILLIIGLLASGIIALVLWVSFRNKSRSNKLLATQKDQIEAQNQQKEVLLKEIHHRVKNNLQVISSLLSLQSNNIQDQHALSAVKEGQNRVKSIALIHQKLYQHEDISRVDFDEYVAELVAYLQSTFNNPDTEVNILVNTNEINLDIDTAVPLGLIINELVSNSFKYAFANMSEGNIRINLSHLERDGQLMLEVSDDGVGLPKELDITLADSLGLKLVRMLCLQLDGHLDYFSDEGSRFEIRIAETDLRKQTA